MISHYFAKNLNWNSLFYENIKNFGIKAIKKKF